LTPLEFEKGVQQLQQQMKLKSKCNHKCSQKTSERCQSICICICGTWAEQMKCLAPNCKDLAITAAETTHKRCFWFAQGVGEANFGGRVAIGVFEVSKESWVK